MTKSIKKPFKFTKSMFTRPPRKCNFIIYNENSEIGMNLEFWLEMDLDKYLENDSDFNTRVHNWMKTNGFREGSTGADIFSFTYDVHMLLSRKRMRELKASYRKN